MSGDQEPPAGRMIDDAAGPMVRPYVMTGGRLVASSQLDLITQVVTTDEAGTNRSVLGPEQSAIIHAASEPISVAELATHLDLPPATVRVLLGDLLEEGLVLTQEPQPEADVHDLQLYKAVLNGLREL
ncbi:MAG TPA: DUF742 domain-containing protein [Streptosporangiaceae bacterium]